MKVHNYWIACVLAAVAAANALAQPAEESARAVRPGHLVDSASPNTSMAIPGWDSDSASDAQRPTQPEPAENPGRDANRESITAENDIAIGGLEGSADHQAEIESNPDANAATIIPRPGVMDQTASADEQVVPRSAVDSPWYRHPAIALFVVVAVIVAVAKLFRKYVPTSRMIPMQAVRVVGRAPISAKHSIALLHVGRRLLLVGMTADRVSTLSEITDPNEVSLLLGASGSAANSQQAFGAQLADRINQFGMSAPDESDAASDLEGRSLLDETKGQLQNLMRKLRSLRAA